MKMRCNFWVLVTLNAKGFFAEVIASALSWWRVKLLQMTLDKDLMRQIHVQGQVLDNGTARLYSFLVDMF